LRSELRLIPAAVAFVTLLPVIGQVLNKADLGGAGVWNLPSIPDVMPTGGVPFNSKGKQV